MASSSAKGIRAGRAYVELFADDSKLVRGLRNAGKRLESWGKGIHRHADDGGGQGGCSNPP